MIDYPKAELYASVGRKTSPMMMAIYKQFGGSYQYKPQLASITLAQLIKIEMTVYPWDFASYLPEAKQLHLNGIHWPFWRDWPLAKPSVFLIPELLHHWYKMFWDHDAKWCIHVVGATEIDFWFSILQPHVGFHHFPEGISGLKQVTGHEHHNIQYYIVGIITGAVSRSFLIAIWALMDFQYLCQAKGIDDEGCDWILAALEEFHRYKSSIVGAGAWVGKKNRPINDWYILKLELMKSVVPNIQANGTVIQFSTDVTECTHITKIKNPAHIGNNQNYKLQICHDLNHTDKLCCFELTMSICAPHSIPLDYSKSEHTEQSNPFAQLITSSLQSPTILMKVQFFVPTLRPYIHSVHS